MMQIKQTRLFYETVNTKERIIIHRGGARSSKSISILNYIIWRMTNEKNSKILITRKTMPALRLTAYKDFIDLLKKYKLYNYCNHSLTTNTIVYRPTNAYIVFVSIDNPERIKSTGWNVIFMEEANEFTYNDYMILKTRLSAPTEIGNKLIMAFNPVDSFCWIKTKVIDKENDVKEIVSNYKDNPFLQADYVKDLEELVNTDKNYYKIYTLGEWGSLDNLIYNNWTISNTVPIYDRTIYGCDYGFNSPSAIIECGLMQDSIYLREVLYRSGLTNSDLIDYINNNLPQGSIIYCDSAEPNRIEEMRRAGINAIAANKSVKDGIDFCKRQKLIVHEDSINLIKELRSYKYAIKQDNIIDEPVKYNDHLMDAMRYAIYTHLGRTINYQLITPGD